MPAVVRSHHGASWPVGIGVEEGTLEARPERELDQPLADHFWIQPEPVEPPEGLQIARLPGPEYVGQEDAVGVVADEDLLDGVESTLGGRSISMLAAATNPPLELEWAAMIPLALSRA